MTCKRSDLGHPSPGDIDSPDKLVLLRLAEEGLSSGDSLRKRRRRPSGDQRGLKSDELLSCDGLSKLATFALDQTVQRLIDEPDADETVAIGHHNDRVKPHGFEARREEERGVEARCEPVSQHCGDTPRLLAAPLEAGRRIGIGERLGRHRRPKRRGEEVSTSLIARLIAIEGRRMPAASENLRRRLEKRSKRRVVGGHESRQKLSHRAHAAPLVPGEHADRHRSLCDQRSAVEQSELENPTLGLVQLVEVRSVDLDVDVLE